MSAWVEVLTAMSAELHTSIRGTIRSNEAGETTNDVRVWRAPGGKFRVEDPSGEVLFISDGQNSWKFRDGEPPVSGPAKRVRYLGPECDMIYPRLPGDWLGDDFTQPTGAVLDIDFLGRKCWEVELAPPPRKPSPMQLVVDADTGAVLAERNDAVGLSIAYTDVAVGQPLDSGLFTWTGASRSEEEMLAEHRARAIEAEQANLNWFREHVTGNRLVVPIELDLTPDTIRTLDSATGAFEASVSRGFMVCLFARRPRSDEPWDLHWSGTIHRWSTATFDWAIAVHGAEFGDEALRALQQQLQRSE
ncbi:hypothetical protein IEU95_08670 [Hoyosella rhizosphaerae]|uniref:Uncharacterized protein n=1 Tax=Hoyosella rhizosphaerae TaxID=1755582 RepID=A0A916U0K8_9ACTN|nr:hypothetical protein [Hoyosella rhizosphaerae]MBN4926902.1 hypothetical protein [Hoyosella rhizosphaerae]GGC55628.1 hypothetical protein GCM10011410_05020 [Hoyosella rhizosphaerae]